MTTVKHTRPWVRLCIGVLAGGELAFSAFGLAGGIAEATPAAVPSYHWCPGDQWDPAWGNNYNWDWNQCHDWQGPAGQGASAGWGPWGPPPPWAPPPPPPPAWAPEAHLMWNPTVSQWGFWNNGVWTSV
ncbi:MAG TPA: hypothetical protein VGI68_19500 [Mycobacterium sp.]|jgi:hypothetical protein